MKIQGNIITVGLAPAWDLTCQGNNLHWGKHSVLNDQCMVPAGKALNVSRALAWLGHASVAAGLWGQDDHQQMQENLARTGPKIQQHMTPVPGRTRVNVTVLDQSRHRELHLRSTQSLVTPSALEALGHDLQTHHTPRTVFVLAGALPTASFGNQVLTLAQSCAQTAGARLVIDAHGPVFRRLVNAGLPWLIKPNVHELDELLGIKMPNRTSSLIKAARTLSDRVPLVLISRGKRGAILVTKDQAWQGQCLDQGQVVSTVGCGDSLLAGFLYGLTKHTRPATALATALKCATARAWGWTDQKTWSTANKQIRVQVEPV